MFLVVAIVCQYWNNQFFRTWKLLDAYLRQSAEIPVYAAPSTSPSQALDPHVPGAAQVKRIFDLNRDRILRFLWESRRGLL